MNTDTGEFTRMTIKADGSFPQKCPGMYRAAAVTQGSGTEQSDGLSGKNR
ncbi:MAG: hypothetical protein JO323_21610 [Acidobacteriia bacterium]|nr:hypothetical protein [Terriglobia bacterium]